MSSCFVKVMNHLQVQSVYKSIKGIDVVCDVSLSISSGDITGILGPNGSGKTSLFYLITGLTAIDKGHIYLNGEDIGSLPFYLRSQKGIIYLPQESSILGELTVYDNLMLVFSKESLPLVQKEQKLMSLVMDIGIEALLHKKAKVLSGGERRKVEICRCLALKPKILLLDEPFSGLDPVVIGDIKIFIKNIRDRGVGVLITDHNVRDTLELCDRVFVLRSGRVVMQGSQEEVVNSNVVREFYFGKDFQAS